LAFEELSPTTFLARSAIVYADRVAVVDPGNSHIENYFQDRNVWQARFEEP
jgi:hypothetical protein